MDTTLGLLFHVIYYLLRWFYNASRGFILKLLEWTTLDGGTTVRIIQIYVSYTLVQWNLFWAANVISELYNWYPKDRQ